MAKYIFLARLPALRDRRPAMTMPADPTPSVRARLARYVALVTAGPSDRVVRDRLVAGIGALVGIVATRAC